MMTRKMTRKIKAFCCFNGKKTTNSRHFMSINDIKWDVLGKKHS